MRSQSASTGTVHTCIAENAGNGRPVNCLCPKLAILLINLSLLKTVQMLKGYNVSCYIAPGGKIGNRAGTVLSAKSTATLALWAST